MLTPCVCALCALAVTCLKRCWAQVNAKIGSQHLPMSITIMEKGPDFLFGLDMLRRYQCSIDLKANVLRFSVTPEVCSSHVPLLASECYHRLQDACTAAHMQTCLHLSLLGAAWHCCETPWMVLAARLCKDMPWQTLMRGQVSSSILTSTAFHSAQPHMAGQHLLTGAIHLGFSLTADACRWRCPSCTSMSCRRPCALRCSRRKRPRRRQV